MSRLLSAILLGAAAAALLMVLLTGDTSRLWIAIVGWVLATLLFVLGLIARAAGPVIDPRAVEQARREGRTAGALVLGLQRTGTAYNDVPEYVIELLVDPMDRPAYRTHLTRLLDGAQMYAWQPGSLHQVVRPGAEAPDVVMMAEPAQPMREIDPATVPVWDPDPDAKVPGRSRPLIPVGRRHRVARRTLFLAAGAAAAVAVAWPDREEISAHARAFPHRDTLMDYVRGPGRAETAIESFREQTGLTRATEVLVYDRYLLITAPTSPGATTYDRYELRGGRVGRPSPASSQPDPADEFALADIAWGTLPGLYEQLVAELALTEDELNGAHLHAGVRRVGLPTDDSVQLNVYLATDYRDGTLTADQDGTVHEIR